MARIDQEIKDIESDQPIGCDIYPTDSNKYIWEGILFGPKDTPYHQGWFKLKLIFPRGWDGSKRPEAYFVKPVYHFNVNQNKCDEGYRICVAVKGWNRRSTTRDLIGAIRDLLLSPEIGAHDPYDSEIRNQWKNSRASFNSKAKEWTQKYAPMEY